MKRTVLFRYLVLVLSLGILVMSLTGCEGPAGPAGPAGTMNTVPLFMQGTWKFETGLGSTSWIFTADSAKYVPPMVTNGYEVILLSFNFDGNGDAGTWDTYPGGYAMEGMQVKGGANINWNDNHYIWQGFYFNSTLDAFAFYNNSGDYVGVFQKQ